MADLLAPMDLRHVPAVADLHAAAFPNFFLTSLGTRFLRCLYRALVEKDDGIGFVVRDRVTGLVVGLVAGTAGSEQSYSGMFRARARSFGWAALPALLARPRLFPMLMRRVRSEGHPPPDGNLSYLASIAVDPAAQASGFGRMLMDAWSAEIRRRGGTGFYLTTDAEANDAVLAFYERCGMRLESTFESFEGRPMRRYVAVFE